MSDNEKLIRISDDQHNFILLIFDSELIQTRTDLETGKTIHIADYFISGTAFNKEPLSVISAPSKEGSQICAVVLTGIVT